MTHRIAPALAAILAASCAPAAPRPPPPPVASAKPPPPAAPLSPARWLDGRLTSDVGVRVPSGRLMLLRGKRVLVADDGKVTQTEAPERLEILLVVPASGERRVLAVAGRTLWRFDDPLGPGRKLAVFSQDIQGIGSWPGRVLVRSGGATQWLDLDGKKVAAPAAALQPQHVEFLDDENGLAHFAGVGVARTSDGGATWALVDHAPTNHLHADEGWLRVGAKRLDPATGSLSDPPERPEPILVRWVRLFGDPLDGAVRTGIDLRNGRALVAGGDQLLEVDLSTGLPVSSISLTAHLSHGLVPLTRWTAAPFTKVDGSRGAHLFLSVPDALPAPVLELELGPTVKVKKLRDAANQAGVPIGSSSGGLFVRGSCQANESAPKGSEPGEAFCVKQPGGGFKTVWGPSLFEAAGPLLDGGVVGVAPMMEREDVVEAVRLVVVDSQSKVKKLPEIGGQNPLGALVERPVDEIAPGVFAALLVLPHGGAGAPPFAASIVQDGKERLVHVSAEQWGGRGCHAGRCAVAGYEALHVSLDGGATWREAPAPKDLPGNALDIVVSDVGLAWGPALRIGWGDSAGPVLAAFADPPDEGAATLLPDPPPKQQTIACEAGKPVPKALGQLGTEAAVRAALEPPAKKGISRKLDVQWTAGLRTQGLLLVERPDDKGKPAPAGKGTLGLHWIDASEVGAKARSASAPLPAGFGESGTVLLRYVLASGDRAFFVATSGSKWIVGRATSGKLELADYPQTRPPRDAAIGADGSVSWVGDDGVGVWLAREKPRSIAKVRPAQFAVGAPTKDGVPLVTGERGWAALRILPIPKDAAPAWVDVTGWKAAPFVPGSLGVLRPCEAKAPSHRFVFSASLIPVELVGAGKPRSTSVAVRADAEKACLEGVTAAWSDRFARIDLAKKKAEGGTGGSDPKVTALVCKTK